MTRNLILKLLIFVASMSFYSSCTNLNNKNSGTANLDEDLAIAGNIVGGVDADLKFQRENGIVGIVIIAEDGPGICTGTLIHKRLVLTAAHCIEGTSSAIQRIAVVFDTNLNTKVAKNRIRYARTGEAHDEFMISAMTGAPSWSDIALLKLSEDAPEDFKLAKLPSVMFENALNPRANLIQAGFGKAEASRDSKEDTSGVLRKVANIEIISKNEDGKELLLKEDGKGSCNGDSGGPAFLKVGSRLLQVGINSRGTSPTSCLEVGVFTNVMSHLAWIKKTSDKLLASDDLPKAADASKPQPSEPQPTAPSSPEEPTPAPGQVMSGKAMKLSLNDSDLI